MGAWSHLIREIETSNRQFKTDIELCPIYHQKDDNSDAHLFFGLLAYWLVNTIRYKLKRNGITHYWTKLKHILSTQKVITSEAENALGERVELRICSGQQTLPPNYIAFSDTIPCRLNDTQSRQHLLQIKNL